MANEVMMTKEYHDDICVSGSAMTRYLEQGWQVSRALYGKAETPEEAEKNSADPIKAMEAELADLKKAKTAEINRAKAAA